MTDCWDCHGHKLLVDDSQYVLCSTCYPAAKGWTVRMSKWGIAFAIPSTKRIIINEALFSDKWNFLLWDLLDHEVKHVKKGLLEDLTHDWKEGSIPSRSKMMLLFMKENPRAITQLSPIRIHENDVIVIWAHLILYAPLMIGAAMLALIIMKYYGG